MSEKINFAFFGTPDVASETLEILKESGFLPSLIITSPDKPQGRRMIVTPPPAKVWATENKIPYIQPEKLDREFTLKLSTFNFQLFVVVAYGHIIPKSILSLPKFGSINIHYSLLPKYRGASPVESAILNGDTETGVTIQQMEFKLDSGPILAQEETIIAPDEKAPELRKRLIKIGGEMLVKILETPSLSEHSPSTRGRWEGEKQNESEATYCSKIKKEDGLIDLENNPEKNYNKFRAYATWPRTFFFINNKRVIITEATLENNQFVIKKVLPEGKKEIRYEEFLRANTSK